MASDEPVPAEASTAHSTVGLDERRLRLLLEVGRSVVAELDLEVVLVNVLKAAQELTGARYAALGVLAPDRRSLERFVTSGIDDEAQARIGPLPRGRGILGVLIDEPRALRLADVGAHPRSYGFPPEHPPMATFLGVPVVIRGQAWGNLYLTEKATGPFDEQDEAAIVVLAGWAATAVDNARRYQAESSRRDLLERAVRAFETTTEIARAIGSETRLEPVLELIVKRGRALVGAQSMVLLLHDDAELVVTAVAGAVDADLVGQRVPIEGSATGAVLRGRRPELIADVPGRLRFGLGERIEAAKGLLVPLLFHGQALGVLGAFDRITGGPAFSAEDERLMEAFAASAATAVATAQNVAAMGLRRSIEAAEAERGRWARELHDDTLQELAALKIGLAGARRAKDLETVTGALEAAVAQIDSTIRDLRAIINDLRPPSLDALGVVPAVAALVERSRARSDVDIAFSADLAFDAGRSPHRLQPAIELAVYRLVQEALTNAVRHAGASSVGVVLSEDADVLHGVIRDDGTGFEPGDPHAGFGLIGMHERATFAGGSLAIVSSPDGTEIRFWVPAARRPAPETAPPD
jgi:signal transduction histidine kinase